MRVSLDKKSEMLLRAALKKLGDPKELAKAVKPVLQEGANAVARSARRHLTAYRTGALYSAISRGRFRRRKRSQLLWAAVGVQDTGGDINPARYAHLIEFGHKKGGWARSAGGRVEARPFMRIAARKWRGIIHSRLQRALKRKLGL